MTEIALRCRCGTVRGVARGVTPESVNHLFCYCDDCQAFAHHLGRADDVLDAYGGTEITQMSQAAIAFTAGTDRIAALRLTPTGLLRWYAACCGTPIGNTLNSSTLPFIGLIHAFVDAPSAALGPVRGRGWTRHARGGRDAVPDGGTPGLITLVRMFTRMMRWRLRGDHKRSPLFDAAGKPLVEPRVLGAAEREVLRQRCARWRGEAAAGA
jgi:hypothetical protein